MAASLPHLRTLLPCLAALALSAGGVPASDWTQQAALDAREDRRTLIFDGRPPDSLACDTTLRIMPDGSWVMVMLGGGHREPLPENHVVLSRSLDEGRTWSPMENADLGIKREGNTAALVPTELSVHEGRCTLYFATHDGRFAGWKEWMAVSTDSCRTWGAPVPAPGRLQDRTFIRNQIVTRDGRLILPFQHYLDAPGPRNPRNGVLISSDGGKTWTEHGNIRLTPDDHYSGWAENNIVELADGRIAMIIRADRLGGVLYYAESADGGRTWPELAVKTSIPNPGSKATLYSLGGDAVALLHNPNPKHRSPLALWVSFDGMKTWPFQRVLVAESSDGPAGKLAYPDGVVSADRKWLHFAFDDNRDQAVYIGAKLPPIPADPATSARPAAGKGPSDYVAKLAAGLKPSRSLVYKKVAGRELSLHVFEPPGFTSGDPRTCYITIHGGGWGGMDPSRMFPFAAHFARQGMVGISVQYRLFNAKAGVTVFDCVKDARSAVRYVRAHAAEFGIDPARIIVSGGSAGGHLAAATALFDTVNEAGEDLSISCRPDALVLLFPVIDTSAEGYGNAKIGARWQELSPVHHVKPGLPPTLIFHGTGDKVTPFPGAKAYQEAMVKAGGRCDLDIHEGGEHGYLMRTQELYEDTQKKTEQFFKSLNL